MTVTSAPHYADDQVALWRGDALALLRTRLAQGALIEETA